MSEKKIEAPFDLKKEISKYLSYWKFFAVSIAVSLLSCFFYLRYTNPIFLIEAKIKILDENKGLKLPTDIFSALGKKSEINIENEVEIIKSKRLFEPVVRELNLQTEYFGQGRFLNKEIGNPPVKITALVSKDSMFEPIEFQIRIHEQGYSILSEGNKTFLKEKKAFAKISGISFRIEPNPEYDKKYKNKELIVKVVPFKNVVEKLTKRIRVTQIGKESEILLIQIEDANTEKSVKTIHQIIQAFNNDGINDRRLVNLKTVEFIDERFKYLTQELDSIENNKKNFKRANDLSFIEADAALDIAEKSTSDNSLFEIETQIELSNLLKEALEKNSASILPSNIGLDNTIINELISKYNTMLIQQEKLLKTAGSQNPSAKGIELELQNIKNNINQSIAIYSRQLNISLSQQKFNNNKFKNTISDIPINEKILRGIERQQTIKENLYLLLLQKREESAIAYAVTSPSIKIVEYSNASIKPIAPRKAITFFAALITGMLVPFVALYAFFAFDTKIKSVLDREFANSEIPVIAEIPFFENFKIFENKDDRSVNAEMFRILATNSLFSLPLKDKEMGQTILITSSIAGEGKTFVATNLALALASYSHRVLLIGADMRKPRLADALGMTGIKEGLSDYLHDSKKKWKDAVVRRNRYNENLDILFSGYTPPNPSSLLSNGKFGLLLQEAVKEYDYIIIDSVPTIYVNDTFIISSWADLTIYITRQNYTEKVLMSFVEKLYRTNKLRNLTLVLNAIKNKGHYNYGYGYGYGEGDRDRKG